MTSPVHQSIFKFKKHVLFIHPSFWYTFSKLKVAKFKLDTSPIKIWARIDYMTENSNAVLDQESFSQPEIIPVGTKYLSGTLLNFNIAKDFSSTNPNKHINSLMEKQLESWKEANTQNNFEFCVVSFADIKKWVFNYWVAFPTIPWSSMSSSPIQLTKPTLSFEESQKFLEKSIDLIPSNKSFAFFDSQTLSFVPQWNDSCILCFQDSCRLDETCDWDLRNILNMLVISKSIKDSSNICLFLIRPTATENSIKVYSIYFPSFDPSKKPCTTGLCTFKRKNKISIVQTMELDHLLNPAHLMKSSVDLNIQLMKWRMLPSLDLDKIKSQKVLLFGAGTLGCNVARVLLGYGFQNFTFVDSGRVSFSNPVRQTLFTFKDCQGKGKFKAEAAAARLNEIVPHIQSSGYVCEIPMPDHPIFGDSTSKSSHFKKFVESVTLIDSLVQSHDVLFLLTDSRESRWFPSLLGKKYDKIVINVALGFESFSIIRHGGSISNKTTIPVESTHTISNLGCWFCQDISAPANSLIDRTLDKQCTVTRPGLSFMAASTASELYVSLLHHPLGNKAPHFQNEQKRQTDFGILPHQINYWLNSFSSDFLHGPEFKQCIACSDSVVEQYTKNGHSFIHSVCADGQQLLTTTGLATLLSSVNMDDDWLNDDF